MLTGVSSYFIYIKLLIIQVFLDRFLFNSTSYFIKKIISTVTYTSFNQAASKVKIEVKKKY